MHFLKALGFDVASISAEAGAVAEQPELLVLYRDHVSFSLYKYSRLADSLAS